MLEKLEEFARKLLTDAAFAQRAQRDPEAAVAPFGLSGAAYHGAVALCQRPALVASTGQGGTASLVGPAGTWI